MQVSFTNNAQLWPDQLSTNPSTILQRERLYTQYISSIISANSSNHRHNESNKNI